MGLFDLFRKSEWEKLKNFSVGVQQDIGNLVALNALTKAAVVNSVRRVQGLGGPSPSSSNNSLCKALAEESVTHELHLAVLSTGIGKEFSVIQWAYLPPSKAVSILGILAMCEYRNAELLTVENDLKHSGYIVDPDQARTQMLVLLANQLNLEDLEKLRIFDVEVFRDFWLDLRRVIFSDIQLNVVSEQVGLSLANKERFERLSAPRKEILLLLADSLSKKSPNADEKTEQPKAPVPPFNLAQSQADHPFKYVPYTKLIYLSRRVSREVAKFVDTLAINDYELRRLIGAKSNLSNALLEEIFELDANVAAYCVVMSAVLKREPDFLLSGVCKKLNEELQNKNMKGLALTAQAMMRGYLGDALTDVDSDPYKAASISLDLIQKIRRSPGKFIKEGGGKNSSLPSLVAGTITIKHILNHPRYGKSLEQFFISTFDSLNPLLDEIESGKLLTWDEQTKLTVQ